jgi:hypothetical protein
VRQIVRGSADELSIYMVTEGRAGPFRLNFSTRGLRTLPLIAVCLFLSAGFGHAETEPKEHPLKGLKQISLEIELLNQDAQTCGITRELIHDAFMYPASSSKLKISDDLINLQPDVATFYIQVTTHYTKTLGLCFTGINMQAHIYQSLKLPFADRVKGFNVKLWDDETIGVSAANQHGRQIQGMIEDYTKKFLTAWNLDNKPQ